MSLPGSPLSRYFQFCAAARQWGPGAAVTLGVTDVMGRQPRPGSLRLASEWLWLATHAKSAPLFNAPIVTLPTPTTTTVASCRPRCTLALYEPVPHVADPSPSLQTVPPTRKVTSAPCTRRGAQPSWILGGLKAVCRRLRRPPQRPRSRHRSYTCVPVDTPAPAAARRCACTLLSV